MSNFDVHHCHMVFASVKEDDEPSSPKDDKEQLLVIIFMM
jgi:hypothetical protein